MMLALETVELAKIEQVYVFTGHDQHGEDH